MAHPPHLREKARALRKEKGLTVDELADRMALSRSTIYYWVRDIPIPRKPATHFPESARQKGYRAMRDKYRRLREVAYDQAVIEIPSRFQSPSFRDFICLYIAEGYKRDRNMVSICNSDLAVMKVAHDCLLSLARNPLRYAIQYHADQNLSEIREFWALGLGIDPRLIKLQRKSNSNGLKGRTWRSEHGVLKIEVGETYLRAELQAWMDFLQNGWLDSTN